MQQRNLQLSRLISLIMKESQRYSGATSARLDLQRLMQEEACSPAALNKSEKAVPAERSASAADSPAQMHTPGVCSTIESGYMM